MKNNRRNVARRLGWISGVFGLGLILASCTRPPAAAYDNTTPASAAGSAQSVGTNSAGEACILQRNGNAADIYCGGLDQPSAHIENDGAASAAALPELASTSPWRASLDSSYACASPVSGTILDGQPAEILSCTQRLGGWPYAAMVSVVGGQVYYADGVLPALPAMQRGIGLLSGKTTAASASTVAVNDQLLAQTLAAQAYSSGDIGQYNSLMQLGASANQSEDFPAAIIAYRAALSLQQNKIGANNPGTIGPMLELALNLSDEAQYPEAETFFAQAAKLAPRASDPTAAARLAYYRGLDQLNQNNPAGALPYLRQAEAGYAALLPPEVLQPQAMNSDADLFGVTGQSEQGGLLAAQTSLQTPVAQTALLGVIEALRYQAIALHGVGDQPSSHAALTRAQRIAMDNGIAPPTLNARLDRTGATLALAEGQNRAANNDINAAERDFSAGLPGSRPVAETALLQAAVLHDQHKDKEALVACHDGATLMRRLQIGASPALIEPCLEVYDDAAKASPADAQELNSEMFAVAELAQGSVTAQEIAQDAARLSSSSSNPKVAAAIRSDQDAQANLSGLYQQRDTAAQTGGANAAQTLHALDQQIAAATSKLHQASLAEQAAAPNFGQLVQQAVSARAVLALLRPDEAFLGITTTPTQNWLFFLTAGKVDVAHTATGTDEMAGLVKAVRASIETENGQPPAFDMADAGKIYAATLAPFAGQFTSVHELVVAPSGPLLALPFALLPTGPASADSMAQAPWLIRKTTLAYVPAAANFVALRKVAGTSAATRPWFGFGDFVPATLAQAQAEYPPASCPQSAAAFAALPTLPYAKLELQAAAAIFGATPADELTGANFTKANIEHAALQQYKILHFATHAILPTDLPCQPQPAIVISAPAAAASAADAQLTSSDVTNLHLDANMVLLSACNTGGAAAGGEALSGLARSFFYAGARALMVTQWSANDQVSAYLVAETLSHVRGGTGSAGSLRQAQLALIDSAGQGQTPAYLAHPFYWAAFAVIGDGGNAPTVQLSNLANPGGPGG